MKHFSLFFLVSIISCGNVDSERPSKGSSDSVDRTQFDTKLFTTDQDSSNLILNQDLQIKIKALVGLWNLKQVQMIDKNGSVLEYKQASTTIEFTHDHKMISKVNQIVAECHWDYDNTLNQLTTTLEKINGNNAQTTVIQENKIIYLSNNKLVYQFNDPVTGYILEMHYKK